MLQTGIKRLPKCYIPREHLEYLIEYGFKASDISKMLCLCDKTGYRRLEEYGISMQMNYTQITEPELNDLITWNIEHKFPNSGYKSMGVHLLARGVKVQDSRFREAMRRTDSEGTAVRAMELWATHRREYNIVKEPLSLWYMDGNHKVIRWVTFFFFCLVSDKRQI